MKNNTPTVDKPVVLLLLVGIIAFSLFLQQSFKTQQALLFLLGIGLGATLLHAAFGFTSGWRNFIRKRHSAGIRAQLLLLALTSILFFPVFGNVFTGVHGSPALSPVGISVLFGAFIFGLGMQVGGGCGSGTLFAIGGGHVRMLITLLFFIVGATIGSAHLSWWVALPNIGKVSVINELGWMPALLLQIVVLAILYFIVRSIERKKHGNVTSLRSTESRPFTDRLVSGPWPLWWAVIALAILNLLTLILAGHPWTITFAYGLWGTKIWTALGGSIGAWDFWHGPYAYNALNSSVLKDTTTLMDFGIILGAMLAASLAGKFAPDSKINGKAAMTAIVGGLMMGYGARLAFGCNIGGLVAGISSGSLHGWLWLVAGFIGTIFGVWLRVLIKVDKPVGADS